MKKKNFVDFCKCAAEWHVILIHLDYSLALDMLKVLYQETILDNFLVSFHPPFTSCSSYMNGVPKIPDKIRIEFQLRSICDITHSMKKLLNKLHSFTPILTFKLKDRGYRINQHGMIIDEWDLMDFC